jgi:predicted secreted Zn-dependent protease
MAMMAVVKVALAAMAAFGVAFSAQAAPTITAKSQYFNISGKSGMALMSELNRRGPKHGFMSRAIAQTRYSMRSEAEWTYSKGVCKVTKPIVRLDITYIYPKVTGPVSPALKQRWQAFMAGVTEHEEVHGKIARQMAVAAEKAIAKVRVRDGGDCNKLHAQMKRVVNVVVAEHEARQVRFDDNEHREGGNIEGLIGRLVRR